MGLNQVLRDMESAPQERDYLKKEKASFEDRVASAYENPHTLEYTQAVKKAEELRSMGMTSGKLLRRGEEAASKLCGPEIIDVAVVVGALKKLEDMKGA